MATRTKFPDGRRQRFVDEYLIDFNGARAARAAGYKSDPAKQAFRLLGCIDVQKAMAAQIKAREERTRVSQDRVLLELARVAFADLRRVLEWGPDGVKVKSSAELDDNDAAAIAEVSETKTEHGGTIKVKLVSKDRALEMLARHLGMFVDRMLVDDLSQLSDEELGQRIAALSAKIGFPESCEAAR